MAAKPKQEAGGRAGFLNASSAAAIAETIKKEDRTLHRLLQKQIELGRIVLPPEAGASTAEARTSAAEARPSREAVAERVAWLLQAHRGAGQAPHDTAAAAGKQRKSAAQDGGSGSGGAGASEQEEAAAAAAEAEAAARLREQMRDISRSLWGTVSVGAASGAASYTSRSRSDYSWSKAAVAAMRRDGELDARHHRRRDEHAAYVEAAARDAALRRGAKPPGGGGGK